MTEAGRKHLRAQGAGGPAFELLEQLWSGGNAAAIAGAGLQSAYMSAAQEALIEEVGTSSSH